MPADTLPRCCVAMPPAFGARPALREKRGGIWQASNWSDYATLVSRPRARPRRAWLRRGDRLAVIGDNRPRLYAAMLAAQSLGGAGVPLWPDAEPDVIASMLRSRPRPVVVAEDQEQIGKLRAAKEQLPESGPGRVARSARSARWQFRLADRLRRAATAGCGFDSHQSTASPTAIPTTLRCCSAALASRRHAEPRQPAARPRTPSPKSRTCAGPTRHCASCRWPGSATCSTRWPWACRLVSPATVLKARRPPARSARDRPAYPDRAADDLGSMVTLHRGSRGACRPGRNARRSVGLVASAKLLNVAARPTSRAAHATRRAGPGRAPGVCAAARPAWAVPSALGAHGRHAGRPRSAAALSQLRCQPEAELRSGGTRRACHRAPRDPVTAGTVGFPVSGTEVRIADRWRGAGTRGHGLPRLRRRLMHRRTARTTDEAGGAPVTQAQSMPRAG